GMYTSLSDACRSGVPCKALFWGGLGGYGSNSLVQSGFGADGNNIYAFYEYFQGGGPGGTWVGPVTVLPQSQFPFNIGDYVWSAGMAMNANATYNAKAPWAFFSFIDSTAGIIAGGAGGNVKLQANTSGTYAYPLNAQTIEAITEQNNAGFDLVGFGL